MAVQTIPNPKGQAISITVEPGQDILFDFISGGGVDFERPDNQSSPDLVIKFDDGGQITLSNFFVVPSAEMLPTLAFSDAPTPAPGDSYLAQVGIDTTPADAPITPNDGTPGYDATVPDLTDGLELSEALGTTGWAGQVGIATVMDTGLTLLGDPTVSTPFYDARAVFYEPDPNNASAFSFNMALQGGGIGQDAMVRSSENGYVDITTISYDPIKGCYTATVSDEGIAAMKAGSKQLYDYIEVEGPDGTIYTVQVVLNQSGSFNSTAENAKNPPDGNFKGEWHTQITDSVNLNTSSRNNDDIGDRVWLTGMTANGHNNRVITNAGADTVNIENGVLASPGYSNTINTGKSVGDSINIGDNVVAAGGKNTLTSGEININASTADAALIAKGGVNTLDAKGGVNLTVDVSGKNAAGVDAMNVGGAGHNIINVDLGAAIIDVHSSNSRETAGLKAAGGSSNTITAERMELTVVAENVPGKDGTSVNGLQSFGKDSINSITVDTGAEILVDSEGAKNAAGLRTIDATNQITATEGDLELQVYNTTGVAAGMYAGLSNAQDANYLGKNVLDAQNGNIDITVDGGSQSSGMEAVHAGYADANGARSAGNFINADGPMGGDVNMLVGDLTSSKTSIGMNAVDSGYNSITATGEVNIGVEANKTAYGMRALDGNSVDGHSLNEIHADTVSVSASVAANGGKAYAMSARSEGSNEIHGIEVTLTADSINGDAFAMYATDKGINLVQLTAKGTVTINGDIYQTDDGENNLLGSADNDTFIINGKVSGADALFINGGEGNEDKLVLMAENKTEFMDRYGDWLANPDSIKGIEFIEVRYSEQNVDLSDFTELQAMLQAAMPDADIIYSLGDGDSVLTVNDGAFDFGTADFYLHGGLGMDTLDLGKVSGTYTLADIADMIDGFEVLDLGGFPGNNLTITIGDASLDDLGLAPNGEQYETLLSGYFAKDATILRISGDAGDIVTADQATWEAYTPKGTANSYCEINKITYDMFYNTEDSNQFLLIQQTIMGG